MKAGQRVRIKSAPDRIGVLTDDKQIVAGKTRWRVQFPEGSQHIPERNLELVEDNESLESLINGLKFGDPSQLRGAVTHARLTGRLADVIYSMEATNTEYLPYQFKPVLNFLESPSNGILIADEVGLGKTIEAGLIWTELRARVDANRLLILCPAVLKQKWIAELSRRFGIRAEECDANGLLQCLMDERSKVDGFAVVASLQGLRPPKSWQDEANPVNGAARLARFIEDLDSEDDLFDCVIIDEAHYLRNPESQTHKLAKLVRPVSKYVVLLSATPIQLKSEDLFHLLNVIDNENFAYPDAFQQVIECNRPLLELAGRLKLGKYSVESLLEDVQKALGANPLLAGNRQLQSILDHPPDAEDIRDIDFRVRLANRIERINLLGNVISRTRKREAQPNRVIREPSAPEIPMTEIERDFYEQVTHLVRKYCQRFGLFEGFLLTIPQRQMCSSMPAAMRSWLKKIGAFDVDVITESIGDDDSADDYATEKGNAGPLVEKLSEIAQGISDYETLKAHDSKYRALTNLLDEYWRKNDGHKVVLFSFYRETLHYLHERLEEDGISAGLMMGGMDKEPVIERFRQPNGPHILLTSEVLSEGVDLQFASALLNYDMPWNPMRVEQRIGRIDRIGQQKERILIWNFFYKDTLDDRIYDRLFKRLDIFRTSLGDLEAVLGEKIKRLSYELLSHELSPEQELQKIEQTRLAIANEKQNQEYLEEEAAGLVAHGDYVLRRVAAAKEMRRYIEGRHLWIYVRDFLKRKYPGSNLTIKNQDPLYVAVDLSTRAKTDFQAFLDRNKSLPRSRLGSNPTGKPVTCCFSNQVDFSKADYEVVNQYHPLVRFVATNQKADFHPLVAVKVDKRELGCELEGQFIIATKRWSTTGARTIERLVYSAVDLDSGKELPDEVAEKVMTVAVSNGVPWDEARAVLDGKPLMEIYHRLEDSFDEAFDEYCANMRLENEDRVDFLIKTLNGQIDRQIRSRREAIEKLKSKGDLRLVKANEGYIRKLGEKRQRRILEFEQRRAISTEPKDVTLVVAYVG